MRLFRTLVLLCGLLSSLSLVAAPKFVFTAIPDQDETQLQARFGKVADYLSAQLGIEVSYIPVKSYAAAVTAFRNNQVQLAWFGGLSGVQARRLVPGAQAIAQGYEDQFFKSYFIANTTTGLEPGAALPAQLAGKTFTFGSKGSTSGRLMPEYYLRQQFQQAPSALFDRVGFSGDHTQTVLQVEAGAYQVGAVNYKVWEQMVADGKVDTSKVKVIWETPTYPDYQWTIRGDLDPLYGEGFAQRVQQVLLSMTQAELLASFPRQSFVKATNEDYLPILNTAQQIGLIEQ